MSEGGDPDALDLSAADDEPRAVVVRVGVEERAHGRGVGPGAR